MCRKNKSKKSTPYTLCVSNTLQGFPVSIVLPVDLKLQFEVSVVESGETLDGVL